MNLTKVSIILPTYNRVNTLKECISSVLNQNYINWELIIVDDSTTREVEELSKKFVMEDIRIIYHKNKIKKGLPGSRNVGVSISSYNLVLFIEDDLVLESDTLNILVHDYEVLKLSGEKIGAIAPSRPWIQDRYLHTKYYLDNGLDIPCKRSKYTGVIFCNFVPKFKKLMEVPDVHSCSLYDKKAILDVGRYDEYRYKGNFLYEETDLNYRIQKKGYKLFFEPKAIMYHRITDSGGCRVNALNYGYYFVLNHIKYVTKNYNLQSIYMIPLFFIYVCCQGIRQRLFNKRLDS
jgi:glycosyltransferase involved in cell wall biosynthesis